MNRIDGTTGPFLHRRGFLAGGAALAATTLLPAAPLVAASGPATPAGSTAPGPRAASVAPAAPPPAPAAAARTLRVQRLAWAGVRLQLPGSTTFIDPLVDPAYWGAALGDRMPGVDDAVGDARILVTHAHGDHFDPMAVRQALAKGGSLVHPAATGPLPAPPGTRVRPATTWEPMMLGDFDCVAVPAVDGYGDPQVSWVVSAGGRRIFHGGDTLWHGEWWRIGRQYGPFDAAFLPVNGASFGWRKPVSGQPGVLTPEQAVAAATILGARRLVPIHYGVSGIAEYIEVEDPIGRVRRAMEGRDLELVLLAPGNWLDWKD